MNAMPMPGSELKDWGKLEAYWPDQNLRAKAHLYQGPHLVIVPAEFLSCSSKPDEPRNAAASQSHGACA
jgi:hypothetical protein